MTDFKDLIIIFVVGLAIGYVLKGASGASGAVPAQVPVEMSNLETWDMKELSDGTIRVVVHRNVKRGG